MNERIEKITLDVVPILIYPNTIKQRTQSNLVNVNETVHSAVLKQRRRNLLSSDRRCFFQNLPAYVLYV
jgi:hypothetical protein